jgi:hypothetical protein
MLAAPLAGSPVPYPAISHPETSVVGPEAGIGACVGDYIGTYLNDHLAGATVGRELSKRAAGENEGTPLGAYLEKLHAEIAEDRQTLLEVMDALDVGEDHLKTVAARVGERIGRLKPNGNLLSYSPLSRVVELEGLKLGVAGKESLWKALGQHADPRLDGFDFPALAQRAERQRAGIEKHRLAAAKLAFEESD